MKKLCSIIISTALIITAVIMPVSSTSAATISSSDYATAFKDSIWFYDANKCGKEVAQDNVFSWRAACHTSDGSDVGKDLTGGYHDAGDHIKFGITQGYAASILGWSYYEFKDAYDATGNSKKILSTLKYFTDFFIKSRVSATKYYYHIGDPSDHDYWGSPEAQVGSRGTRYFVDPSSPASDVCGLYSASLTQMYLNYKSIDATYAAKCLEISKELYALGKMSKGVCKADAFYTSSAWEDDMAWAAMWLYIAEKNNTYLTDVSSFLPSPGTNWTICWNDMKLAVACLGASVTGEAKYKDAVSSNINYWKNSVPKSSAGLRILNSWGTLRYTAAECMLALTYYKQTNDESLKTFAKSQIDYIMGANPANMSYIVGFGSNYPKYPHHRAANGQSGWGNWKLPAKNVLTGALVGGPNASDQYTDQVDKYECSEVAIDYNAGLVGALAAMTKYYGNIQLNTPTPTTPPTNTPTPTHTQYLKISGYVKSTDNTSDIGFNVDVTGTMPSSKVSDASGYFEHTVIIQPGTSYSLKISKPGYLGRTFSNITSDTQFGTVSTPVEMWFGDLIKDDAINMADILEVAKSYNSTIGDSRYVALSDIDKDNAVGMSDILIVARHFNKTIIDYPQPSIQR